MTSNVAPSAGRNFWKRPDGRLTETSVPRVSWSPVIPSFVENSVQSSPRSRKTGSSLPRPGSKLEAEFALQVRANNLPPPSREHKFHPTRKWRLDFAWPDQKVGVEIEGGVWTGGRHTRGAGFIRDADKHNAAQLQGWLLLRFTSDHLKDGTAMQHVKEALGL
jgi:very-short-patch-repair endonuclease